MAAPCEAKQEVANEARRLLSQPGVQPKRIRAIYGHRVYSGLHHLLPDPARYVTVLREVVSLYNHHAGIASDPSHDLHQRDRDVMIISGQTISFENWLEDIYTGNHMVRFLYYAMEGDLVDSPGTMSEIHLAAAKRFVDSCWFVGTTETGKDDFRVINEAIGMAAPKQRENVSKEFAALTPEYPLRQRIREIDALDWQLYQQAKAHRQPVYDEVGK